MCPKGDIPKRDILVGDTLSLPKSSECLSK